MKRLILFIILLLPMLVSAKTISIGIVSSSGDSHLSNLIKSETESFISGSYSSEARQFFFEPSDLLKDVDSKIKEASEKSDIIIILGDVAVGRAYNLKDIKPAIAISSSPIGAESPFRYSIFSEVDYRGDLKVFRDLFKFNEMKILASSYVACSSNVCADSIAKIFRSIEVPYEKISVEDISAESLRKSLNEGDSVLVMEQPQLSESEYISLLNNLAELKVRTFSFGSYRDIEKGMLAVNSPDKDYTKTARTAAVAAMEIISGKSGYDEIKIARTTGLVINMAAANVSGFAPGWEYLRSAELVNYDKAVTIDKYISYKDALSKAVESNEDVASGLIELETAKELVDMSKSALRPTINLKSTIAKIDEDRARAAQGTAPEQTVDVALEIQQIIYSEEVLSLRDQAIFNEKSKAALAEQAELDVLKAAASAYLGVLRAKTYNNIALDNLKTTKENYNLARNRDLAGAANPAELSRWEARIALAKIDVSNSSNTMKSAMTELARIIGEDIDGVYDLEDIGLESKYTIIDVIGKHKDIINNRKTFAEFKKRMIAEAVKNSVELKSLSYLAQAADRSVLSAERSYYHPTVALGGSYRRFIDKSGDGDKFAYDWYNDNEWNVGLTATIPLYEGGKRKAELNLEKANRRILSHTKARVTKLVKQRMITSMENARTAYDSYFLAMESANAANKTLEIVSDLYSKGAVSITDLIDAQNAKFNADTNAASSLYAFLEKIVDVERAYGKFSAFATDEENSKIIDLLISIKN